MKRFETFSLSFKNIRFECLISRNSEGEKVQNNIITILSIMLVFFSFNKREISQAHTHWEKDFSNSSFNILYVGLFLFVL